MFKKNVCYKIFKKSFKLIFLNLQAHHESLFLVIKFCIIMKFEENTSY